MACMKLGSKSDAFHREGQAWFCTTGLPSDVVVVEVGEMSFHLHKFARSSLMQFPLLSRSGVMEGLISDASEEGEEACNIYLPDTPGGAKTFELLAKFCYGVKLELTASNVVYLQCAAEHLEMTEECGESNIITHTESFLNQVVLRNWKDSLKALETCDDILPYAEELNITKQCIESLATKASTDPNLFGWPVKEHGGPMQSPGGSVLWNGISTGARPKKSSSDWWYVISEEVNGVLDSSSNSSMLEADCISKNDLDDIEDGDSDIYDEPNSLQEKGSGASKGRELSIYYLENDVGIFQSE